jgi:hypothetical protein
MLRICTVAFLVMTASSMANAQDCANGRCSVPAKVSGIVAGAVQPVAKAVSAVVESRPVRRAFGVTYRVALGPDRLLRRHRVHYRR